MSEAPAPLSSVLAELQAARARVRELERDIAEIIASPTWRLAVRLRGAKRTLENAGPMGRAGARLIRIVQVVANEGPSGVWSRVKARLRPAPEPPPPQAPPPPPSHEAPVRPRLVVPPLAEASGASIIIPLVDDAPLYDCLKWMVERTPAGCYEIIVVDQVANDETSRLLALFDGVHVVRGVGHRGLVNARNQGAKEARSPYLLFLSAHTFLLEGWLTPMLETLATEPAVAAVGPLLLGLDGPIQEAGGIIWRDGSATSYGRGADRHEPEFRYRRDVDYVAGACILVRREVYAELGGFDSDFGQLAYDDADLCFRMQALGHRVVFEPRSTVVHLQEPWTAPGPEAADTEADRPRREEGRRRFVDKHRAVLAERMAAGGSCRRARDRRPGLRVLIVDHMVPAPDRDAGSVRMLWLLRILGELGHAVTFIPDNLTPAEPYTAQLQRLGVEVIYGEVGIVDWIVRRLDDFDAIIVCRAPIAGKHLPALAATSAHPVLVFDTVDLHYLRAERQAALLGDPEMARLAARAKTQEMELARAATQVWVVSPHEAELLHVEDPGLNIEVVPLVYQTRAARTGFDDRRDIIFVGGFRHPPNEDAIGHFVRDIWPLVKPRLPGVRFVAVGPDVTEAIAALAGPDVVIAGHVPDLDLLLDASRVFVAPIRFGAGLKGKIIQSLACGLPVVTTAVGAEGLELTDGEQALLADDTFRFAEHIVHLYEDAALWRRLSERGRRHAQARFGPTAVKAVLARTLGSLTHGHRPPAGRPDGRAVSVAHGNSG